MEARPERFFTPQKIAWWVVYNLMLAGIAGIWIFINVQFLGHDVSIQDPAYAYDKPAKHR